MATEDAPEERPRRWQRRERRRSERERIVKHGASVKRVYPAAIRKRLRKTTG